LPRKRVGVLPIEPASICEEIHSKKTHMKKNIKIVVIGGSGLIGTRVVKSLRQRGHKVVAASPSSGVNTLTGEGLAEALNDA
jgi:glutamate dehydrogenase/leucine dehydrogenase